MEREFTETDREYWNNIPISDLGAKIVERGYSGLVARNGMAWGAYVETGEAMHYGKES